MTISHTRQADAIERGIYVPEGLNRAAIKAVAEALQDRYEFDRYSAQDIARTALWAVHERANTLPESG